MGQKGDLCAPKIAAMMKLQKFSALKALGMKLADDERTEVTTGGTLGRTRVGLARSRKSTTTTNDQDPECFYRRATEIS